MYAFEGVLFSDPDIFTRYPEFGSAVDQPKAIRARLPTPIEFHATDGVTLLVSLSCSQEGVGQQSDFGWASSHLRDERNRGT